MNPDRLRLMNGEPDYRDNLADSLGYTIRGCANQPETASHSNGADCLTGANSSQPEASRRQASVSGETLEPKTAFSVAGFVFPKSLDVDKRPDSIIITKKRRYHTAGKKNGIIKQNAIVVFRCLVFYGHFSDHPEYLIAVARDLYSTQTVYLSALESLIQIYTAARSAYCVQNPTNLRPASATNQEKVLMALVDDFEHIMSARQAYNITLSRVAYIDATRKAWRRQFAADPGQLFVTGFAMPPPPEADWMTGGTPATSIFLQDKAKPTRESRSPSPPRLSMPQARSPFHVRSLDQQAGNLNQEEESETPMGIATPKATQGLSRPQSISTPAAANVTTAPKSQLLQTRLRNARLQAQRKSSGSQPPAPAFSYGPGPMEGVTQSETAPACATFTEAASNQVGFRQAVSSQCASSSSTVTQPQSVKPIPVAGRVQFATGIHDEAPHNDSGGRKNCQGIKLEKVGGRTPGQSTLSPFLMDISAGLLPPSRAQQNAVPSSMKASATPAAAAATHISPGDQSKGGAAQKATKKFADVVLNAKTKYEELAKKHNLSDILHSKVMNQIKILEGVAGFAAEVDEDLRRLG